MARKENEVVYVTKATLDGFVFAYLGLNEKQREEFIECLGNMKQPFLKYLNDIIGGK